MKKLLSLLLILLLVTPVFAAVVSWRQVKTPSVESVQQDLRKLTVNIKAVTGDEGGDKIEVLLFKDGKQVDSKTLGKSKNSERKVVFDMKASGNYQVSVRLTRKTEKNPIDSSSFSFSYTLPLDSPQVSAMNMGSSVMQVSWAPVDEAQYYKVDVKKYTDGSFVKTETVYKTSASIKDLKEGEPYLLIVTAFRGDTQSSSIPLKKTFSSTKDRVWNFTYFGQSTKQSLNKFELLDSDDLKFKLITCTYDDKGNTIEKGGKYTAFHDGVSFYYTKVDAKNENFVLEATFTVDYINPVADGQEGFGLLVMDSLGQDGVNSVNHYTNSVGLIATKFEATIDGSKKTCKDTLGARFVYDLTEEIISKSDSAIAENAKSVSQAYSYDQSELVKKGDVYRLKLVKSNTGYHCIYEKEIASEDTIEEYILYDPSRLLQIDSESVYVGFSAARGCNVTVSDVKFTVTDPSTDPPAQSEPDTLVPLVAQVDSPSAYHAFDYPFVFSSNADGVLTIKTSKNAILVSGAKVRAFEDFTTILKLNKGFNDYVVSFTPDSSYRPEPKSVMASYNKLTKQYEEDYSTRTINHSVSCMSYEGDVLYVSPNGSILGKGTKADPLDLAFALMYVKPGQTIELSGGVYRLSSMLKIDRGNSGTKDAVKTLRSAKNERAIFDFSGASSGGMQLWGDWWVIQGIDIRNTPDNVKGLQIAGDYNVIESVNAYKCRDTGIQISGTSSETWDKWPHDNLVINCTAYDNCDPAENNADGFAAKLTCGDNNRFIGCIAYNNIDDGWDLFTKIESGPIGSVLIKDCVAFGNGSLSDGSGNGDGNGFKLGGDGISVAHQIENCIAYSNGTAGITSNSNPSLQVRNCTLYSNGTYNLTLYSKSDGNTNFVVSNLLSMDAPFSDNIDEQPSLVSNDNFFNNGAVAVNKAGKSFNKSIFKSVDLKSIPTRFADGSINMNGVLQQSTGYGASF